MEPEEEPNSAPKTDTGARGLLASGSRFAASILPVFIGVSWSLGHAGVGHCPHVADGRQWLVSGQANAYKRHALGSC